MTPEDLIPKVPKRIGRPPKKEIEGKKRGSRAVMGRPKGDASVIEEYKARLLASPKSKKVLDSIMNAALDDDHKNQSAAWKLLVDRLLPLSYFEKDKTGGGRNNVSITITGVGGEKTVVGSTLEGEMDD